MKTSVYVKWAFVLMIALWSSFAQATEDPVAFLQNVTDEMISALKENKISDSGSPKKVYGIIEKILVPHADFTEMSRWVAGRQAWTRASDEERRGFISALKELVIRTYAVSVSQYENQTVQYYPVRGGIEGRRQVQVSSTINEPGKDSIRVDYRLMLEEGHWKVYDIIIEGVSLISGFQNQFSDDIQRSGLASVTQKIKNHNYEQGNE